MPEYGGSEIELLGLIGAKMAETDFLNKSVTAGDQGSVQGGVISLVIPQTWTYSNNMPLPPQPPAYWSRGRDEVLRSTVYNEAMWAAAVYIAITKIASKSWRIDSTSDRRARQFQELYLMADGQQIGWVQFLSKHLADFLVTDNGSFTEIIRERKSVGSKIVGLRHLDSMRCLGRETRVLLADGKTMAIMDIVRKKYSGDVVAFNESTGKLEPRKITNWYENNLDGRKWLRIETKHAKHTYGRTQKIWATDDHPFLTSTGWKDAGNLRPGDEIVTQHPAPSWGQASMLVGALLGDSSISKNQYAAIDFAQGEAQKEWLDLKIKSMKGFGFSPIRTIPARIMTIAGKKAFANRVYQTSTHRTPAFMDWWDAWYKDGKHVARELIEEYYGPLMLATWYMDDGNLMFSGVPGRKPAVRFAVNDYSQDDKDWLVEFLKSKGFDARLHKNEIYIPVHASMEFLQTVAPYIPPVLRYKLPPLPSSFDFSPDLWDLGEAERFMDTVVEVKAGDNGQQATTFCIDVEEHHNFIAGDLVVHNCTRTGDPAIPALYRDRRNRIHELKAHQVMMFSDMPDPGEMYFGVGRSAAGRSYNAIYKLAAIEWYLREKVAGLSPLALYIVNGLVQAQIEGAVRAAKEQTVAKGLAAYMGAVIIGVPSDKPPEVATIPLAELPDRFERKQEFDLSILTYADNIGLDPQDLQPLSGQGFGTGAQSIVLAEKSSGRGLASWQQQWTHQNNTLVLPDFTTWVWFEKDLRDMAAQADYEGKRIANMKAAIEGGIVMPEQAVDQDILPKEFLPKDETSGGSMADDEKMTPTQPKDEEAEAMPETTTEGETPETEGESVEDVPEVKEFKPPIAAARKLLEKTKRKLDTGKKFERAERKQRLEIIGDEKSS